MLGSRPTRPDWMEITAHIDLGKICSWRWALAAMCVSPVVTSGSVVRHEQYSSEVQERGCSSTIRGAQRYSRLLNVRPRHRRPWLGRRVRTPEEYGNEPDISR